MFGPRGFNIGTKGAIKIALQPSAQTVSSFSLTFFVVLLTNIYFYGTFKQYQWYINHLNTCNINSHCILIYKHFSCINWYSKWNEAYYRFDIQSHNNYLRIKYSLFESSQCWRPVCVETPTIHVLCDTEQLVDPLHTPPSRYRLEVLRNVKEP